MAPRPRRGRAALIGRRPRVPQHVVFRNFPNETVVLNLENGKYHGLNPTAGRMLDALDQGATVREAAAAVALEYGRPREEVEDDMVRLCQALLERGLIEVDDG